MLSGELCLGHCQVHDKLLDIVGFFCFYCCFLTDEDIIGITSTRLLRVFLGIFKIDKNEKNVGKIQRDCDLIEMLDKFLFS